MPFEFGKKKHSKPPQDDGETSNRKKPPNYFSRRVQIRLLVLVSLFMIVLLLMDEARKPKNYRWMFGREAGQEEPVQKREATTENENRDAEIDTALPPTAVTPADPPGLIRTGESKAKQTAVPSDSWLDQEDAPRDALWRAKFVGWSRVLDSIESADSFLFFSTLQAGIDKQAVDDAQRTDLSRLIATMDDAWGGYLSTARRSIASDDESPDQSRASDWLRLINTIEAEWANDIKPAFEKLTYGEVASDDAQKRFQEIDEMCERIAFHAIRDNAVLKWSEKPSPSAHLRSLASDGFASDENSLTRTYRLRAVIQAARHVSPEVGDDSRQSPPGGISSLCEKCLRNRRLLPALDSASGRA